MNGSTTGATAPIVPVIDWACIANALACSASRRASSAICDGSMLGLRYSGGLGGQEARVHDRTTPGQHDAFDDVVGFRQQRRSGGFVPERRQKGEQVLRIQR